MHQVKKLCEPDVIDLSAKKSESSVSATASVGDVTLSASASDTSATVTNAVIADKHPSDTTPTAAVGHPDGTRQSNTVAPSGSSPRMWVSIHLMYC